MRFNVLEERERVYINEKREKTYELACTLSAQDSCMEKRE